MNKLIFHIGMPKTGTTFLQDILFPKVFGSNFLNKNYSKSVNKGNRIEFLLSQNQNFLLSHEKWFGIDTIFIKRNSRSNDFMNTINSIPSNRIKIILVLRRHKDYITSAFLQKYKKNQVSSFENFLKDCNPNIFNYYNHLKVFLEKGYELLILDYEDLKKNPEGFLNEVVKFSEIEVEAIPKDYFLIKRKKNLSPKSDIELKAVRIFSILTLKGFKYFSKKIKRYSKSLTKFLEYYVSIRDWSIKFTRIIFPSRFHKPIFFPDLPKELEVKFDEDWMKMEPYITHIT